MNVSRTTSTAAIGPTTPVRSHAPSLPWLSLPLLVPLPWMALVLAPTIIWDRAWLAFRRTRLATWIGGYLQAASVWTARRMLKDVRDAPYLYTLFGVGILVPGAFLASLWWQASLRPGFSWPAAYLYNVLLMGPYMRFFAYTSTLIHKEGHQPRGLFKPRFRYLNHFFGYVLGIFYGHVPESYPIGHLRIHHKYDNGPDDVTSTLSLDRTQPSHWLVYLRQFVLYWSGISVVRHFHKKGKMRLALRMARGTLLFYGITAAFMVYDLPFGFAYLLLPHLCTILYLAAINYTWHAFADPECPDNEYISSVTILDGQYNVFNEDYHVAHHLYPQMHWTEMANHYHKNLARYRENMATIFRDTQEFEIFIWIVLRRFDTMARHFVDLTGTLSHEEKVALLTHRMRPVYPPAK